MLHRNFLILLGVICLLTRPLAAQSHLWSVDNYYPGPTYNTGDTEFHTWVYSDWDLNVYGSFLAQGDLSINQDLNVDNVYITLAGGTVNPNFATNMSVELWSGLSLNVSTSWGVSQTWFHSGIDLGDLTYDAADTPALNISQDMDGPHYLPTINFIGYDANTTWVWQHSNTYGPFVDPWYDPTSYRYNTDLGNLTTQMTLSGNGKLIVGEGATLVVDPGNGSITSSGNSTKLMAAGAGANFEFDTTVSALVFNAAGAYASITANIAASGAHSIGIGRNLTLTGGKSFAIGNDLSAGYYGSVVFGKANAQPSWLGLGETDTWQSGDPLMVVGNGNSTNPLTINKAGNADFEGVLILNGNVTINGSTATFTHNVSLGANGTSGNVTSTLSSAKGDIPMIGN